MKHRFPFSWGEQRARSEVDRRLNVGSVMNPANMGGSVHRLLSILTSKNGIGSAPCRPCLGKPCRVAESFPCAVRPVSRSSLISSSSLSLFLHDPGLLCFSSLLFFLLLFSHLPKSEWYLFSPPPCSLEDFLLQDDVTDLPSCE